MAARRSKRASYWGPLAMADRMIWPDGGWRAAMRRVRREVFGPQQKARIGIDPKTGKRKTVGVRQGADGRWEAKRK